MANTLLNYIIPGESFAPDGFADLDFVKVMVDGGANINLRNKAGDSAFILAIKGGNIELVKLMAARANFKIRDAQGYPPLILAVKFNSNNGSDQEFSEYISLKMVAELLLTTNVDVKDRDGNTALMHAARDGKLEMVKYLLDAGATPTLKNLAGQSALELTEPNNAEIINLLKSNQSPVHRRASKP